MNGVLLKAAVQNELEMTDEDRRKALKEMQWNLNNR